jgi:hypothetical protein
VDEKTSEAQDRMASEIADVVLGRDVPDEERELFRDLLYDLCNRFSERAGRLYGRDL